MIEINVTPYYCTSWCTDTAGGMSVACGSHAGISAGPCGTGGPCGTAGLCGTADPCGTASRCGTAGPCGTGGSVIFGITLEH